MLVKGNRNREKEIYLFMEDIQYTFIWWDFAKVQLYVLHLYYQNYLIDAEYTIKASVEGSPFAQCHHSMSQIQKIFPCMNAVGIE